MAKAKKDSPKQPPSTVNKKAFHNFELLERFEAGLSLTGSEVKSLRAAQADLDGSYARIEDEECWLVGAKITQYEQAGIYNHDPDRKRKLLLHKAQLSKIRSKLEQRGFTLVPLKIYFNQRGLAKAELALAKGKRQYDKRDSIMKRDQRRDMDRETKRYHK
jgi:SsrA-binding protein